MSLDFDSEQYMQEVLSRGYVVEHEGGRATYARPPGELPGRGRQVWLHVEDDGFRWWQDYNLDPVDVNLLVALNRLSEPGHRFDFSDWEMEMRGFCLDEDLVYDPVALEVEVRANLIDADRRWAGRESA